MSDTPTPADPRAEPPLWARNGYDTPEAFARHNPGRDPETGEPRAAPDALHYIVQHRGTRREIEQGRDFYRIVPESEARSIDYEADVVIGLTGVERRKEMAERVAAALTLAARADLARPATSKDMGPGIVKPIYWMNTSGYQEARTVAGRYSVALREGRWTWWCVDGEMHEVVSEEEGMAAVEADYRRRILSALTPPSEAMDPQEAEHG